MTIIKKLLLGLSREVLQLLGFLRCLSLTSIHCLCWRSCPLDWIPTVMGACENIFKRRRNSWFGNTLVDICIRSPWRPKTVGRPLHDTEGEKLRFWLGPRMGCRGERGREVPPSLHPGEALHMVTGKFSAFFKARARISGMLFLRVSPGALSNKGFLPGIWQSVPINHSLKQTWARGWETRTSVLPLPL